MATTVVRKMMVKNGNKNANSENFPERLERLGREHRHFQQEHAREGVSGSHRRALERKMHRCTADFDRLLSHWVDDQALRNAWWSHLYKGTDPPSEPQLPTAPVFKGLAEVGSQIEIWPSNDGGYDLLVNGSLERHEAIPWQLEPDMIDPVRIGVHTCHEIFTAPPQALQSLSSFLATPGDEPPWQWARALLEDGLINEDFALTPRGYRFLGKATPRPLGAAPPITFGILVLDAARARLFILHTADGEATPTITPLVEVSQTTNPEERTRNSELFADTRPGLRREGPHGPLHGVSDHREGHRRDNERRFAVQVVDEALRLWRAHSVTRMVLVASPAMLGLLRPILSRKNAGPKPWPIRELARDLTRLAPPALHDVLASDGFLPPRGRLPPLWPSPGIPI